MAFHATLPTWMPSTVGPAMPRRASSNTAANATGATRIDHWERVRAPTLAPTPSESPMVVSAWTLLSGPRGIHHPASAPYAAGIRTANAHAIQRTAHKRLQPRRETGRTRCMNVEGDDTDLPAEEDGICFWFMAWCGVLLRSLTVAALVVLPMLSSGWRGAWTWAPDVTLVIALLAVILAATTVLWLAALTPRTHVPAPQRLDPTMGGPHVHA